MSGVAGYQVVPGCTGTWPRTGDYNVEWGAWTDNTGGNGQTYLRFTSGGTQIDEFPGRANGFRGVLSMVSPANGTQSQACQVEAHTNGGTPSLFTENPYFAIMPRRVS